MNAPPLHLDDGALVRLLDGQPAPGDDAAHAAGCAVCQARLRTLDVRSTGFSRLVAAGRVAEADPPPDLWQRVVAAAAPAGARGAAEASPTVDLDRERGLRRGRPALRAAAAAGILLAGALAADPVREWIAAGVERAVDVLRAGNEVATPSSAAGGGLEAAIAVSFVPGTDRLEIRVDAAQADGMIEVAFEDRRDARGEILTDDPAASLLVLPDGFRARNAAGSDWSYRFRLPDSVARVIVMVGDEIFAELAPEDGTVRLPVGR